MIQKYNLTAIALRVWVILAITRRKKNDSTDAGR